MLPAATQGAGAVPPRLESMQPARTQNDAWARDSADETCSNYEYELDDRQPKESIEDLVARSQNALDGLRDAPDSRSREFEDASDYEYEVDSDYGPTGGPIGRMPSRRFGSRSSRKARRGNLGAATRSPTVPGRVMTASVAMTHGVGTPRDAPSIRPLPLSIRKSNNALGDATRRATPRRPSVSGPSRKLTVRRGPSGRKPSVSIIQDADDSFEQSLARMSHMIIRDLPADPANELRQAQANQEHHREHQQQTQQHYQQPHESPMAMPRPSIEKHPYSHYTRPNFDQPRNGSERYRRSPSIVGRNSSSYNRRLEEKARAFEGQGELVEIPIADDDGKRETSSGRNRSLSLNSLNPDQPLPPYSKAPPAGHQGIFEGSRATAAWADAEQAASTHQSDGSIAHGVRLASILLALILAILVVGMDVNILATAVPRINKDLNTFADSSWYGSAFLMAWCAFQIVFGRLYMHLPAKWVFSTALCIFELGSLLAGVSPNSVTLIIGRAIQGIGAGGILSGALIIGTLLVSPSRRPLIGGLVGAVEGLAMITAPIIGGAFTDNVDWRWCFYVNLPIVAVVLAIVILVLRLPEQHATYKPVPTDDHHTFWQKAASFAGKLDMLSSLALVPAVIAMLLALQWGGSKYEWKSGVVISLLIVSVLLLVVFCYCQYMKQDLAMVPPRIFTQRTVLAGFWFMLCTSSALVVITYFLPLWFQVITNATPSNSGARLVPMLVAVVIGMVVSGTLVSVTGHYAPFMLLGTILMSVGAGLLSTWTPTSENVLLVAFPAIFGAGCGIAFQQPIIAAQSVLSDEDMSIGISVILFGQAVGTALVLSVAENLFSSRLITNISDMTGVAVARKTLTEDGAQGVVKAVTSADGSLAQLMSAYNKAITQSFYVPVAMAVLSVIGALAIEWRNVKWAEEFRRREAELAMGEKRHNQGPHSSDFYPNHQRSFMAHSIDPCQAIPHQQHEQPRYSSEDAEASRPQPYDQASARMGSPYDQPGSRMGSPYGQSHHRFGVGAAGQPAPYERQQSGYLPSVANQPGLGLDSNHFNTPPQGHAPASYYEKAPTAGR